MRASERKNIPECSCPCRDGNLHKGGHVPNDEDTAVIVAEPERDSKIDESGRKTCGDLETDRQESLFELSHVP